MAMTQCRECGKPLSTTAATCPHCGHKPERKKTGCFPIAFAMLATVCSTAVIITLATPDAPKPTQQSAADKERSDEEVGALLYLRRNMKNPDSFKLVTFIRTTADTLCITYRGTNGFNAVMTQRHTINASVNSDSPEAWAGHCAGRDGKDVSKAQYALP